MRSTCRIAVLALLGFAAPPVCAAENTSCDNARNTAEMNQCADRVYAAADAALNAAYQASLADIARSGGEKPYDAKSWEAALRASQRAWVAFRDAECKGVVAMEWSGGSGTTVAVLGCMTQLTRQRTDALNERLGKTDGPARVP